jgi:O-antigen ligase
MTKTIARWITLGALFLIPFLALYVSQSLYFPFITGKNFALRALVEIAFGGWIVLAFADKRYRPQFSWTLVAYKTFVFWMLIAAIFAVNPHKALWSNYERMDGWVTLIHLYVLLVVASSVLTVENAWRKWWLTFVGSSAVVTIYGLMQMTGLRAIHQSMTRIDSTLGNAEYLAAYLLFAIIIALWQAVETRARGERWLRYALVVLAGAQTVVLFATGTRGVLIGLIAAAAFGAALLIKEAGKKGRQIGMTIFAALVLLVGGLFVLRDSAFIKNSPNLERIASAFSLKESLGTRFTIWHMTLEGAQEKPLIGWGQEGFNYVFNKYYEPKLYSQEPWFDRAHNLFLDWLIAGGIPALLLFVAVLVSAFRALYRAQISRYQRVFLLSALVGYAVQGLVVFDNLFTFIPFVMILGVAHTVSKRPLRIMEYAREASSSVLDTLVTPAAIVGAALLVWFVNVPSVQAGTHLIQAITPGNSTEARLDFFKQAVDDGGFAHQEIVEQLMPYAGQTALDQSIPADVRTKLVVYANDQIKAELERAPRDARIRLQYALFLRTIGNVADSQAQSALARAESPNKQTILLEQGIESFQLKQYDAAAQYFLQAYNLDRSYQEPVAYYAATLIMQNKLAQAKQVLQQTFGTSVYDHPLIELAYYQTQNWTDLAAALQVKMQKNPDAQTSFQIAAAYAQAGKREAAIEQIRATMAAYPTSTQAQIQGQMLLQYLGVKNAGAANAGTPTTGVRR